MSIDEYIVENLLNTRLNNIKEVQNNLMNGGEIDKKIETLAKNMNITETYARYKVKTDPDIAGLLAKDPSKQNLCELLAKEYIEMSLGQEIIKLPSRGLNAQYVVHGVITVGRQSTDIGKSIDFTWGSNKLTAYMTHKYTNNEGGAQDNQANDATKFLQNASYSNNKKLMFYVGCDGAYYKIKKVRESGVVPETYYEWANRVHGGGRTFVGTTDEIIKHWLDNK